MSYMPANGCNAIRLRCPKFYDDADKCRRGNFMRVKRIVEYNKNKVGSITSSEFMANLLSWKLYSCQPCYINQGAGLISGTREASTNLLVCPFVRPFYIIVTMNSERLAAPR